MLKAELDHISIMDRIGCSLLSFRKLELEDALDRIQGHGFRTVDVFVPSRPGRCNHLDPLSLSDEDVATLKADFASRGLRVSSLNVEPKNLADTDFDPGAPFIRSCLALARQLGAPVVTIPPGRPGWISDENDWLQHASLVASRIPPILDLAEDAGVRLTIEAPHAYTLVDTVARSTRLFELVADPRLGCTFDTSQVQRTGEGSLEEAYRRLGADVLHVHLRDARLRDMLSDILITPGKGECDFFPLFRALLVDGYQGDFNLELEYEGSHTSEFLEGELEFARRYFQILEGGAPIPTEYAQYKSWWYGTYFYVKRSLSHPKAFILSSPRLYSALRPPAKFVREMHRQLAPYRRQKYQAGWVSDWKIGRAPARIRYSPPSAQRRAQTDTKRVGILGCGYTGQLMHGPGFANIPGIEVVGVCDIHPSKAEHLAGRLGCPAFDNIDELVRRTRPDLVVNCTREWQHHATTLSLLENGVDVFCEKMLAQDCCKGEEMVRMAREKGRILGVNFNWRFLPGIRKICEIRDAGALGALRFLRFLCHTSSHHHALDLARHIGGPIRKVSALIRDEPEIRGLKSWNPYVGEMLYLPTIFCLALLETDSGVGVNLTSTGLADAKGLLLHLDAVFQEGTVTLSGILDDDAIGTLSMATKKKLDKRFSLRATPARFSLSFQRSIEAFAHSYLEGKPSPITGQDGLEVMYIERALMKSAQSGAMVAIETNGEIAIARG